MSQLERPQPLVGQQRNQPVQVNTGRRRIPLQPQSVVPEPVQMSSGQRDVMGILAVIGAAGDVAGTIGTMARMDRLQTEADKKELEIYQRGEASHLYKKNYATWSAEIANDNPDWELDEGETFEDRVNAKVDQHTQGASKAFYNEYRKIVPPLLNLLNKRQLIRQQQAKQDLLAIGAEGLSANESGGQIIGDVTLLADQYNLTHRQIMNFLVLPGMQSATGDAFKRLDAYATMIVGKEGFHFQRQKLRDAIKGEGILAEKQLVQDSLRRIADAEGPLAEWQVLEDETPNLPARTVQGEKRRIQNEYAVDFLEEQTAHIMNETKSADELRADWQALTKLDEDTLEHLTQYDYAVLNQKLQQKEAVNERRKDQEYIDDQLGLTMEVTIAEDGSFRYGPEKKTEQQLRDEWKANEDLTNRARRELIGTFAKQVKQNQARLDIIRALTPIPTDVLEPGEAGPIRPPAHAPVNLTEGVHGAEFTEMLVTMHFDENRQLKDQASAANLVNHVLVGKMLPTQLSSMLWKDALRASNADKAGLAAWAIGQLSRNSSKMMTEFVDFAGKEGAPSIWAARDLAAEGKSPAVVVSELRRLQAIDIPVDLPSAEQQIADDKTDMEDAMERTIQKIRANVPHAKLTWGFDPDDPELPPVILNSTRFWWKKAYAADRANGVSTGDAERHADEHAASKFRQHIDLVTFEDRDIIYPVWIRNFRDNKMATSARWGPGFFEEAKADFFKEYPKTAERDWPLIMGMKPNLNDPDGKEWIYVLAGNTAYSPRDNEIAIYTPSLELQGLNDPYQDSLDKMTEKEASFRPLREDGKPPQRFPEFLADWDVFGAVH